MHDNKVLIAGAGIIGGILGKILKQNKVRFKLLKKKRGIEPILIEQLL